MRRAALAALLITCVQTAAFSQIVPPQNSKPAPTAKTDTIPAARDVPYPGTIQLTVDASDVRRAIFRIRQTIPVPGPGDFVLLYPKWVPGGHSPRNDIKNITGFRPTANGRELKWVRDNLDVYAFHIDVPAGVKAIDVDYQYVTPTTIRGVSWQRRTWRASSGCPTRCIPPATSFDRSLCRRRSSYRRVGRWRPRCARAGRPVTASTIP